VHVLHELRLIFGDTIESTRIARGEAGIGTKRRECQIRVFAELLLQGPGVVPRVLCVVAEAGLQGLIVVEVIDMSRRFQARGQINTSAERRVVGRKRRWNIHRPAGIRGNLHEPIGVISASGQCNAR
jgi:hypothetical protein